MEQILQIVRLLRPYWRFIAQLLLIGIMLTFLNLPGPYITKLLIDDVYPHVDYTLLNFVLIIGAVFSITLGLTGSLSDYFERYININMSLVYRSQLYRHVQSLDFSFFDKRETGEILSRFEDMQSAINGTIAMLNGLVLNCIQLLIFPAILFYINWKLALISLAVLPFDALLASISRRFYRKSSHYIAESSAELSAKSYESLASIRTIQALGLELTFYQKLRELIVRVSNLQLKSSLFENGTGFLSILFKTAGSLAYGWYGWTQILQGNLSLGTYMAFSGYVGYLYRPVEGLISLLPQFESTLVHTKRFFEIYNLQPSIQDRADLPRLQNVQGEIAFHDVSFSYDDYGWILRQVNLTIPAAATVALVGRSGSGKTTLAKLIPRFYDPGEGYLSIDGKDIRTYQLKSLRHQIGFAMQGSIMFQGSILENLTFGRDIPLNDVEDAARVAYIHDYVAALPEGYQTEIGEQGTGLSEGQKQRLALARVLLQDTPILILDEPTAALDMESEFYVKEALKTIRLGRTTIIIAHRLSTIQNADEIVVLEYGKVAEQGTHDGLLLESGVYAGLHAQTASI